MKVTCHKVDLKLPRSKHERSVGVHLSGIIRCVAQETGILKRELLEELSLIDVNQDSWWASLDSYSQARICMGLAWEEWYIGTQIPDVVDHPGEMQVDGVYMTPDGESLDVLWVSDKPQWGLRLHECKLSYKSMNTVGWIPGTFDSDKDPHCPLASEFMWNAQTKGYCYGAGTRFVDLHVLFVCGDYSWPQRPVPCRYEVEYTDEEILNNWEMLRNYKQDFEETHR